LRTILLTIVWTGVAAYSWAAESPLLWVEGESAGRSQLHRNAWYDAVDPAELSGGDQIAVRNPSITTATVLDPNGMPVADLPITKDGSGVKLALPENALYVCLQRIP
jgi:hypothetical protein